MKLTVKRGSLVICSDDEVKEEADDDQVDDVPGGSPLLEDSPLSDSGSESMLSMQTDRPSIEAVQKQPESAPKVASKNIENLESNPETVTVVKPVPKPGVQSDTEGDVVTISRDQELTCNEDQNKTQHLQMDVDVSQEYGSNIADLK